MPNVLFIMTKDEREKGIIAISERDRTDAGNKGLIDHLNRALHPERVKPAVLTQLRPFRKSLPQFHATPLVFVSQCPTRSEEHTSELQSLMRSSYAVFRLKNKTTKYT